jgi:hypothetical protein
MDPIVLLIGGIIVASSGMLFEEKSLIGAGIALLWLAAAVAMH